MSLKAEEAGYLHLSLSPSLSLSIYVSLSLSISLLRVPLGFFLADMAI